MSIFVEKVNTSWSKEIVYLNCDFGGRQRIVINSFVLKRVFSVTYSLPQWDYFAPLHVDCRHIFKSNTVCHTVFFFLYIFKVDQHDVLYTYTVKWLVHSSKLTYPLFHLSSFFIGGKSTYKSTLLANFQYTVQYY